MEKNDGSLQEKKKKKSKLSLEFFSGKQRIKALEKPLQEKKAMGTRSKLPTSCLKEPEIGLKWALRRKT